MDVADVRRRRLASQFLTTPGPPTAADVVRTLGAVQAQDYAGAKWALAQRMRTTTDAEIERAFTDGDILRTHVLRPTWHFVAPEDLRWMLALTAPRIRGTMASYDRKLELDDRVFAKSHAALEKALRDGKHLTRAELGAALTKARIAGASGQRLAHLMMRAELDAVVTSGPRRGKQFTYALLDERVPPTKPRDRDDALGEMARRYFATRGPATARDFAWWSGLNASDSRRAIEIAGRALTRALVKDEPVWFVGRDVPRASANAHLLPNYDEYFIGFKDRGAIGHRMANTPRVTGWRSMVMAHVVFVNGELVGGWKRVTTRGKNVVALALATRVTTPEKARIAKAAKRLAAFLGEAVTIAG